MTVTYDQFFPYVLPYAPAVPEMVATTVIQSACMEFCQKSEWWIYDAPAFDSVAGQWAYNPAPPANTQVVRFRSCWYDNLPLIPKSTVELNLLYPYNWREQATQPLYFTNTLLPGELDIVPPPQLSEPGVLVCTLSIMPTITSTGVDDSLLNYWSEVIGRGARARLLERPDEPYSNPQQAMVCWTNFRRGIAEARIQREKSLTRTETRVRPPKVF